MWQRQVSRGGVYSLAFSSDGSTIYSGDAGGWVSAWDRTGTGELRKLFQVHSVIWTLEVARDGKRILAAGPHTFVVWDAEAREFWPPRPLLASNHRFALAADERILAHVENQFIVAFSDMVARGRHPTYPAIHFDDIVSYLAFSPADGMLAVADLKGGLHIIQPGASSTRINSNDPDQLVYYADWRRYLAFSPDGRTLAACSNQSILIWDVPGRGLVRRIKAGRVYVRQLAFHPGGRLLASGGDTPIVSFWDVSTGEEVHRFDWGIGGKIVSLAFAPDGMTAAAGGSNRKFMVWDLDGV